MYYVYSMGVIDYFNGMYQLDDYIAHCLKPSSQFNDEDNECFDTSFSELRRFLLHAFLEAKCISCGWEGDIRGNNIAISAIPIPSGDRGTPLLNVAFKQNNNGQSFFITQIKMDFESFTKRGDITLETEYYNLKPYELIQKMEECNDLVNGLLERKPHVNSCNRIEKIPSVIKFDEQDSFKKKEVKLSTIDINDFVSRK